MLDKVEALDLLEVGQHCFGHERLGQHVLDDFDTESILLHGDLRLRDLQGLLLCVTESSNEGLLLLEQK